MTFETLLGLQYVAHSVLCGNDGALAFHVKFLAQSLYAGPYRVVGGV